MPLTEYSEIVGWVAAARDTVVSVRVDAGGGRFTCRDHPSRNRLAPLDSSWKRGTGEEPRAHFTIVCDVSPDVEEDAALSVGIGSSTEYNQAGR